VPDAADDEVLFAGISLTASRPQSTPELIAVRLPEGLAVGIGKKEV